MMPSMPLLPSSLVQRRAPGAVVVLLALFAPAVRAADLVIEPLETPVAHCNEIVLEIRLTGRDAGVRLSGYQLFLDFPASQLAPLRFEAEAFSSTVYTAGPAPFGAGFDGCPGWGDGELQDMVAIGATVFPDSDGVVVEEVPVDGDLVLGRLVFEQISPVFGSIELFFFPNDESCRDSFDESTAVYDEDGGVIELSTPDFATVTVMDATGPVEDLVCAFDDSETVVLTWTNPPGASFGAIRVLRDGELIDEIDGAAESYRDGSFAGADAPAYTILPLVGAVIGCSATCGTATAGGPFVRGDVNFDGSVNITDGVLVLGFLTGGRVVACLDAADVDDDGLVAITDAIYEFNYLFQSGPRIPPPIDEPGLDPTDDELGCDR